MTTRRTLLFIPTYNEAENVGRMCRELLALGLDADLVFCDDGSPDGTGAIIDRLAREFPRVRAMHRPGKLGIGSAHQDGVRYAYEHGYDTLLTLDCDFTHQPADVRRLLEASEGHTVTVASRYMAGNSLPGWNLLRRSLTYLGHFLTVHLLHLPQDATGALRCYRLNRIPRELFGLVRSHGYSFFFESLFVLHRNGHAVHEIPIQLPARTYGHSKMTVRETLRSASRLLDLFLDNALHPEKFLLYPAIENAGDATLTDAADWDHHEDRGVLAFLAGFCRRLVARRTLDAVIHKHFAPGARLLHAGCGGGRVDQRLSAEMKITAVDLSLPALESYRRNNPRADHVRRADIRHLDFEGGSFDGAYNLGVAGHYSPEQLATILSELGRVVKPAGKIVLFWPHRRTAGGGAWRKVRSLLDSREQARAAVEKAGFSLVDHSFGLKDLLVPAVVVGQKV